MVNVHGSKYVAIDCYAVDTKFELSLPFISYN